MDATMTPLVTFGNVVCMSGSNASIIQNHTEDAKWFNPVPHGYNASIVLLLFYPKTLYTLKGIILIASDHRGIFHQEIGYASPYALGYHGLNTSQT